MSQNINNDWFWGVGIWVNVLFPFVLFLLHKSISSFSPIEILLLLHWIRTFSVLFQSSLCAITPLSLLKLSIPWWFLIQWFLLIACLFSMFSSYSCAFCFVVAVAIRFPQGSYSFLLWIRTSSVIFSNHWKVVHESYWFLYQPPC